MRRPVSLSIYSRQRYSRQEEPDVVELVTDGTMEFRDGGWDIVYEESALTGLEGVTTTFRVEPGKVTLTRTGALKSKMVFQEGVTQDSLYQMPFGTLMLTVHAASVFYDIVPEGGSIDLGYRVNVENTEAGEIDYHLDIRAKEV